MSYTALCTVDLDGDVHEDKEYRNAHGGVAFIWDVLCKKYGVTDKYGYTGTDAWSLLWKKAKDEEFKKAMSEHELYVLYFSYDWAMVSRKYFAELAGNLKKFYDEFNDPARVCHIGSWARDIGNYLDDPNVYAVCIYGMSVGENPWIIYDEDDSRPYNINTDTNHWFVPEG